MAMVPFFARRRIHGSVWNNTFRVTAGSRAFTEVAHLRQACVQAHLIAPDHAYSRPPLWLTLRLDAVPSTTADPLAERLAGRALSGEFSLRKNSGKI